MTEWNEEEHRLKYEMFKTLSKLGMCLIIHLGLPHDIAELDKKAGLTPLFLIVDVGIYKVGICE